MNTPSLRLLNVGCSYKNTNVLQNISFSTYPNEIVSITGANGVGKTTLIKSCVGLIKARGEIQYFSRSLEFYLNRPQTPPFVALLDGDRNIYWRLSIEENIRYFSTIRGINFKHIKERSNVLLDRLGIYKFRKEEVSKLSRGQKQQASIACILAMNPSVVFLDEPTHGLDTRGKYNLVSVLTDSELFQETSIIIVSHDLNFLREVSSRHFLLRDQGLLEQTIQSKTHILVNIAHLERFYNCIQNNTTQDIRISHKDQLFFEVELPEGLQDEVLRQFCQFDISITSLKKESVSL